MAELLASIAPGDQIHLKIRGKLFAPVFLSRLIIANFIVALLGKRAQQLGNYPLIRARFRVVILDWIGTGISCNINDNLFHSLFSAFLLLGRFGLCNMKLNALPLDLAPLRLFPAVAKQRRHPNPRQNKPQARDFDGA